MNKVKKGFTLVELMVVVAIIAILAAVALPMYSKFKQKTKVGTAVRSLESAKTALQAWYEDRGYFTGTTIGADGGNMTNTNDGTSQVGVSLPQIKGMAWGIGTNTSSTIDITFTWQEAECPTAICNGFWRLVCNPDTNKCNVAIQAGGDTDPLNINKDTAGIL